jgi:hypothetical protein
VAELAQILERNAAGLVRLAAIDGGHPVTGMHQDLPSPLTRCGCSAGWPLR